jgi:DNA polymerase-3 subunit alpha
MARFVVEIAVAEPAAFAALAGLLGDCRGGRGEVRVRAPLPEGEATVLLGRDFLLDGELVGHLERLPGVISVNLRTSETRLQLVG